MYQMLIADDEQIVLDGLAKSIDWQSYGVQVVATARSGTDALALARRYRPQIIVTDIRMPGLSGLQLIEALHDELPEARTIIISAYQEFEYAREAIRLRVDSYITKMFKRQTIIDAVCSVVKKLEQDEARTQLEQRLEQRFNESLPILREHFLNLLVLRQAPLPADEGATLRTYGLRLVSPGRLFCLCCSLSMEGADEHLRELKNLGVADLLRSEAEAYWAVEVFKSYKGQIAALLSAQPGADPASLEERFSLLFLIDFAEHLRDRVLKDLGCHMSVGLSRVYSHLAQMPEAWQDAQRALRYRLVYGENAVIPIQNVAQQGALPDAAEWLQPQLEQMQNLIYAGKSEQVKEQVHRMTAAFQASPGQAAYQGVQQMFLQLLSELLRVAQERSLELPGENYGDLYADLLAKESSGEMERWFYSLLDSICAQVCSKNEMQLQRSVQQALDYMGEHVLGNLSLTEVARHVYLNPSYFSRLFKDTMQTSFIEYRKYLKIEKAKELLAGTDYKIYEICDLLGYNSVQYFSALFKKMVGVSPQEYKESQG